MELSGFAVLSGLGVGSKAPKDLVRCRLGVAPVILG